MTARNQAPAIWLILYLGCVLEGVALAALVVPAAGTVGSIILPMFGVLAALGLVLLGIAVWRLSGLVTASPGTWRWVLLAVLALAAALVWFLARANLPAPSEKFVLTVFVLGLGVVLSLILAFAMNTLVKIIAANRAQTRQS